MLNAAHHPNRMSPTAFVSLSSGIVFVIATMVAVALLNVPKSAAAGAGSFSCPLTEVSLDQGYGVTRIGLVPVCVEAVDQAASGNTAAR